MPAIRGSRQMRKNSRRIRRRVGKKHQIEIPLMGLKLAKSPEDCSYNSQLTQLMGQIRRKRQRNQAAANE